MTSLDGDGVRAFPGREFVEFGLEADENERQEGGVVDQTGAGDRVGDEIEWRHEIEDGRDDEHDIGDTDVTVGAVGVGPGQPAESFDLIAELADA